MRYTLVEAIIGIVCFLLIIASWGAIGYVAIHFISKWW